MGKDYEQYLPVEVVDFNHRLADRLVVARATRGVSQTDVAKGMGVTKQRAHYIEQGWHKLTVWDLVRYAEAAGVDPRELIVPKQRPVRNA